VLSKTYYEWAGTFAMEWNWTERGSVDVGLDSVQMEIGIDWEDIDVDPMDDRFDVYFLATDWEEKEKDYSDGEGAIEGPTRAYIGDGKSRGYDVKYHGSYDVYFEGISGEVLFETEDGFYLSWRVPQELKIATVEGDISILDEPRFSGFEMDELGADYGYTYGNFDISIRYEFGEDMLKEDIVLFEKPPGDIESDGTAYLLLTMPVSYSPELSIYVDGERQNNGFVTTSDIEFRNYVDQALVYTLRKPIAIDAKGEEIECEYVIEYGATENDVSLGLRCSFDWFSSAAYPVRIDPTVLENDYYEDGGDVEESLGYSVAVGDFDDDGTEDDVLTGAPYWDNMAKPPGNQPEWGAAYVFHGPVTDNDYTPEAIINLTNESSRDKSDYLGRCVAAADFDGDGVRDDAVMTSNTGAYIVYGEGGILGAIRDADVTLSAPSTGFWGFALAVGNFDGVSGDDLAFSAYDDNSVYLYFYDSTDWSDGVIDGGPDVTLTYSGASSFGRSIAVGDLRDNGATDYDDIAVGAFTNSSYEGAVLVFYGDGNYNDGPLTDYGNADVIISSGANYPIGNNIAERFGMSIAIDDFNEVATTNDWEDLLIGAPYYGSSNEGRAYIYLTQDTAVGGFATANDEDDDAILEESGTGYFGWSVATGDFFGDGISDALIGAWATSGYDGHAYAYNFLGTSIDTISDWDLAGSSGETLGYSVAAGDINVSGYDNFIVGCPYFDDSDPSNSDAGRVLVDEYIPEFQDVIFPLSITVALFVLWRKRSIGKKRD
ncbi:MAG: FG-GAP repeat protein, partial [Thermoplasmata archaeon]